KSIMKYRKILTTRKGIDFASHRVTTPCSRATLHLQRYAPPSSHHLRLFQLRVQRKPFVYLKASSGSPEPRAARPIRNSCGVMPVCLRKKRAKWDGSVNPRS